MKDFDEAYAISRATKSADVQSTLDAFDEVVEVIKAKGDKGEELLKNAEVQKRLEGVLKQMPNHLSAKLLLAQGKGEAPKTLTISGALSQIEIASSGVIRKLGRLMMGSDGEEGEKVDIDSSDRDEAKEAVASLEELTKQIDPRIADYHKSVLKVCKLLADGPGDDDAKDYSKKIREALDNMRSVYTKMMENPEIMEEN
jgi:hypothetical protein